MPIKEPKARLLLIELLPAALSRNEGSILFPFLKGLAREKGLETSWLRFGPRGGTLKGFLDRFRPTHIISSGPLPEGMREQVRALVPRPAFVVMPSSAKSGPGKGLGAGALSREPGDPKHYAKCAWFLGWLGARDPRGPKYLVEAAPPDYAALFADEAAGALEPLISVASGVLCGNRRGAAGKPASSKAASPKGGRHGCDSCGCGRSPLTSPGADLLPLVKKQFRGMIETAGASGRGKGFYEFLDIRAFRKFDEVFKIILRLKVPPGIFLFDPRVDDVLRAKDRIARTLPALVKAGHEIRIPSMRLGDSSEQEGARYSKEIPAAEWARFLALARSWRRDYPSVFKPFSGAAVKAAPAAPAPAAAPLQTKEAEGKGPSALFPLAPLEQAAIDEVGRLLRGGKSKAVEAITIESAGATSPVDPAIRLDLLVDGRALSIALFAPDYPGPFFLQNGCFKVIYLKEDPGWTGNDLGAVSERLRLLVALIERRLDALRAA